MERTGWSSGRCGEIGRDWAIDVADCGKENGEMYARRGLDFDVVKRCRAANCAKGLLVFKENETKA